MNKDKFSAAMKALAVNAGTELTKDILSLYYETLKRFTDDQFDSAVKKILLTWKYNRIPPIAVIVENIEQNGPQRIEDRAEIQATYVISCIGQNYPVFSDPVTAHLMSRRWRWNTWAPAVLESELKWWAKEFKDAYRAFSGPDTTLQIEEMPELRKLTENIGACQ